MAEFKSWRIFRTFCTFIIKKHRFCRPPDIEEFLHAVLATSKAREASIKANKILWRAQVGCQFIKEHQDNDDTRDIPIPFSPKRMKPLIGEAIEGRVNPKGIPCLYLAKTRETAMAEVRPWIGSLISVAKFRILRELKVVNCSKDVFNSYPWEEPEPPEREKAVWSHINKAFSEPVCPNDRIAEYAPTQVLSDLFRVAGYDGIIYRTAFGDGQNVALFNLDVAKIVKRFLFEVKKIDFEFKEVKNPYFYRVFKDLE